MLFETYFVYCVKYKIMNSKDLRVGNWINLYDDFNHEVTGLTNTNKVWFVDSPQDQICAWRIDKIKPIPLTEEWLLKFGFVLDDQECYSIWNGALNYSMCLDNGFCFGQGMDYSNEIEIKHVHQLQNLYFALTGKELLFVNSKV